MGWKKVSFTVFSVFQASRLPKDAPKWCIGRCYFMHHFISDKSLESTVPPSGWIELLPGNIHFAFLAVAKRARGG